MIRFATRADTTPLLTLSESSGLFDASEIELLSNMLDSYFGNEQEDEDEFWLIDEGAGGACQGLAFCAPEIMSDRTWNLLLIAVAPDLQRSGLGGQMLGHIEQVLAEREGRMLIIETSGLGTFDRTRAFYRKNGYDEEARIRDFYTTGDDKVVFRRLLASQA